MPGTKRFRLSPDHYRTLTYEPGSCVASDLITVGGERVGFMYRKEPDDEHDSGWRILAGSESEEYTNDPANFELWAINSIANYDPAIVPHLDAPFGSAFARDDTGTLVEETDWEMPLEEPAGPAEMVEHHVDREWTVKVAGYFHRCDQEGAYGLIVPGRSVYARAMRGDPSSTPSTLLHMVKQHPEEPLRRFEPPHPLLTRYAHLHREPDPERRSRWALYGITAVRNRSLFLSIYFDRKERLSWALAVWDSVTFGAVA